MISLIKSNTEASPTNLFNKTELYNYFNIRETIKLSYPVSATRLPIHVGSRVLVAYLAIVS